MRNYRALAAVLLAVVIGAAGALLLSSGTWQVITAVRPKPAGDIVAHISGRTLQPAITGLGIVALAGVVAVLATRGLARRLVGVLVAVAGIIIVWRAAVAVGAVGATRARSLVNDHQTGVSLDPNVAPHVATHAIGPILTVVGGILIAAGGLLVAARGQAWSAMSGRYEAPTQAARAARPSDLAVWTALDRGDDPTLAAPPPPDDDPPAGDSPVDGPRPVDPDPAVRTES